MNKVQRIVSTDMKTISMPHPGQDMVPWLSQNMWDYSQVPCLWPSPLNTKTCLDDFEIPNIMALNLLVVVVEIRLNCKAGRLNSFKLLKS